MKIREIIPKSLIDYCRLIINKKRFPTSTILTPYVSKNVVFGNNISLSRDVYIDENVVIGDYTYVHNNTMIVSGTIGKFCSIAFNCQIGMWQHPTNYISTSPKTYANSNIFGFKHIWEHTNGPSVGNDVWIGSNAVISRGVTIGDGAIVGANAVVTKDIPPYAIVAGVPAKVIKYRFDEETIDLLLKYKWWDMEKEELLSLKSFFELGEDGVKELVNKMKKNID
ncbi:CatB-related O-acetyltransferase [Clostridium gasigenes]|uniref:CatB-related O-acetyltransferase n=1 Tax=Clostridium gasigenes TaxID=94869 RepID=UPI001438358A|nr:CatB-related O-acetyltransferase [Clostridium gasigenes]NKF08517.1 CatB-related O-acetyltransferase [Clostridium gasigenes]QSW21329.1 CatB-related O-acetyltransferase [Clostridium gasigenes]